MTDPNQKGFLNKILKKQFPTLLGIGILLVALVAGVFLLSGNTNVFSPRATPETTPKNVKITNLTENGFTISFLTDDKVAGFLKYGESAANLNNQISDDRDQLSGSIGQFNTHHISVRGLSPNSTYYYIVGTGSGSTFDNGGTPFSIKTLQSSGTPSAAKTVYGKVFAANATPADGAIVYITSPGIGELSGLVKDSANWAIPLSSARKSDGNYADLSNAAQLAFSVQGELPTQTYKLSLAVSAAQPVPDITFGQTANLAQSSPSPTPEIENAMTDAESSSSATTMAGTDQNLTDLIDTLKQSSASGSLSDLIEEVKDTVELDRESTEEAVVVNTTQPTITGKILPHVEVKISVHSDTQIEQTLMTDENGEFKLDISQLQEQLEPGEHTVEYCYIDPNTTEEVCKTETFYVEDTSSSDTLLAQANIGSVTSDTSTSSSTSSTSSSSTYPYSSGNPYSMGSESAEASSSSSSSKGGVSYPSTKSGVPVSGSVGTTLALIFGGIFFIMAGGWSYFLASKVERQN